MVLPAPMRALGDEYVLAEFRRHRAAAPEFVAPFLREWSEYVALLHAQTQGRTPERQGPGRPRVGRALRPDELDRLSDEQVGQLYELRSETTKPWSAT